MNTLAARTLPEVLLSLALNSVILVFFLFLCLGIVSCVVLGVCFLLDFFFPLGKKKGKVKLMGDSGFWIGWTVCTVITVFWVIGYFRSN